MNHIREEISFLLQPEIWIYEFQKEHEFEFTEEWNIFEPMTVAENSRKTRKILRKHRKILRKHRKILRKHRKILGKNLEYIFSEKPENPGKFSEKPVNLENSNNV